MAGKQNNNQHKDADFCYFGKGIDGYVHYKQAFDRNFSEDNSYKKDDSANYHHRSQSNAAQKSKGSTCASNKHFEPAQTVNGRTYKPIVRTTADVDKTKRLKDENPYNHRVKAWKMTHQRSLTAFTTHQHRSRIHNTIRQARAKVIRTVLALRFARLSYLF